MRGWSQGAPALVRQAAGCLERALAIAAADGPSSGLGTLQKLAGEVRQLSDDIDQGVDAAARESAAGHV